jgi:hypothetical protein
MRILSSVFGLKGIRNKLLEYKQLFTKLDSKHTAMMCIEFKLLIIKYKLKTQNL